MKPRWRLDIGVWIVFAALAGAILMYGAMREELRYTRAVLHVYQWKAQHAPPCDQRFPFLRP